MPQAHKILGGTEENRQVFWRQNMIYNISFSKKIIINKNYKKASTCGWQPAQNSFYSYIEHTALRRGIISHDTIKILLIF